MKVYVAGGAEVAHALRALGHVVVNDPGASARASPLAQVERQTFAQEVDLMLGADILVADATLPDTTVGWALAWFLAKGRLVIVLCQKEARKGLPALVAGNPSPWCRIVPYDRLSDVAGALAQVFDSR